MNSVGLFAGIGGIELGLEEHNIKTLMLCEIMPEAKCILKNRFHISELETDVRDIKEIANTDILSGGFPCQNISIAGNKKGIQGKESSLIHEVFRILNASQQRPKYIILENVANIISLNKGEGLKYITDELYKLGYNWAYRLIDPRSFGIPQRRPRFILVASNIKHPKHLLFPENEDLTAAIVDKIPTTNILSPAYGFYWTEGKIGIGWANNSIPPLKCGSTLGLPSAPAIWDRHKNFFGTPDIRDAERLQGFPENWTQPLEKEGFKASLRWKLVGNAVNPKISSWIGKQIQNETYFCIDSDRTHKSSCKPWPKAAFNDNADVIEIKASLYPNGIHYTPILDFLKYPLKPLSLRAALGFKKRVLESTLIKYPEDFITSLNTYILETYNHD